MKNRSLKLVKVTGYLHEVQIAQAKLANEGIRRFIIDENLNSTIGTSFIEGYKLMVDIGDFEDALSILSLHKT